MPYIDNDHDLFSTMVKELYSAVIGDVMDELNYMHQFAPPSIQPLSESMVLAGRALPVLAADDDGNLDSQFGEKPFGLMLEALDDLRENEVYVCSGASPNYALWGELMSTRAKRLGSTGAVVNGYSRDTKGILALDFPTFSQGRYSKDQRGRGKVVDFRSPIRLGQVLVSPGDIVFGDRDGVCFIPTEIENEVVAKALDRAREESVVKQALEDGMSACDAFTKYGVL